MSLFNDLDAALRLLRDDMDRTVAWRLAVTGLLVAAGGLLAGLAPLALKGLVDAAGRPSGESLSAVSAALAAAYLGALAGGRVLSEVRPWLVAAAEQRLYARLRARYFAHLLQLPLSFHRDRQGGALVQILHQAILGFQIVVFNLVNSVVPVLVEIGTVMLVLSTLGEPLLLCTFAATAIAYLAVLRLRAPELRQSAQGVSEASIELQGKLADGLLNVETIKCFNAQPTVRARFEAAAAILERRWATFQSERLRVGLATAAVFALSLSALLAIALQATLHGRLSVGGFVLTTVYMLQVARPLETLGTASRDLVQAVAFIRPLMDILRVIVEVVEAHPQHGVHDHQPGMRTPTPITRSTGSAPALSLKDVCFGYAGGGEVLHGISLDIPLGHRIAIVGASGCGKSTLTRLLLRLEDPSAGSIVLDRRDMGTLTREEVRRRIVVVPQDAQLFNDTVAFNIGIGSTLASRAEVETAARIARVHDFICTLPAGYETVIGERGLKLSGGERQRIAIARAVLTRPSIYLFDEATSMLDGPTELAILRSLEAVSAGHNLLVGHSLEPMAQEDVAVPRVQTTQALAQASHPLPRQHDRLGIGRGIDQHHVLEHHLLTTADPRAMRIH